MLFQSMPDGGDNGANESPSSLSEEILDTLAEETDTGHRELPPLYDAVDPEALDRLFANRENGTVTFSFCGYEVTVNQAGEIVIQSE